MFTDLENSVMSLLLEAPVIADGSSLDAETIQILVRQWERAKLKERKWTDVGFFTDFQLPEAIETVTPANFELGNVAAEISGFELEVGFLLFVRDGQINFLEGFSYEDPGVVWNEQSLVSKIFRTD